MHSDAKILVLGHRGLIGSAIMRHLKSRGHEKLAGASRAEVDLENAMAVEDYFAAWRPDYVFLCAGTVGGIEQNRTYPADFILSNLAIQLNVLKAAQRHDVTRLILFASSCIYPRETSQPMAEEAILTGPPEPTSLSYAISKLAGLQMCLAMNAQYGGQRFIPVIPNSVYGPHDNFDPASGHVLSALIHRIHQASLRGDAEVVIWGTGAPKREFIHADDVAEACVHLMDSDLSADAGPFNIGTGSDLPIIELARMVAKVVGYSGAIVCDPARPDGAPRKLLDSSKINRTGWFPKRSLQDGLESTYAWYLSEYGNGQQP